MARICAAVLVLLLSAAAHRTVRLARADLDYRSFTLSSIRKAIHLEPNRALYRFGLAEVLAADGQDSREELRQAASLKPDDPAIHLKLGLQAEFRNGFAEAERELLAAARVSRKYEPRWTLANYYFRRGDAENFWRWTKGALEVSYGNRRPLFDLCWAMTRDPETILARAIPPRRDVQLEYAWYLAGHRAWATAGALAVKAATGAEKRNTGLLLALADGLISAGRLPNALSIWNSLSGRALIPCARLAPAAGVSLTNGDFESPPLNRAFDWRISKAAGYHVAVTPAGLRISLSGDQPERCAILTQFLPVVGGGRYRLGYRYLSASTPFSSGTAASGLSWEVLAATGPDRLLAGSSVLRDDGRFDEHLTFSVPEDKNVVRLVLRHARAPGTTRMEGSVSLERVTLELLDSDSVTM